MIANKVRGDILKSEHRHIVFAINTEGYNDAGFAGLISNKFWPSLANTGEKPLGTVLHHEITGRSFHAIVCHSLRGEGWKTAPKLIEEGLNSLEVDPKDSIGVVMMGAGMIGQIQGANVEANLQAMEKAKHKVTVYSL